MKVPLLWSTGEPAHGQKTSICRPSQGTSLSFLCYTMGITRKPLGESARFSTWGFSRFLLWGFCLPGRSLSSSSTLSLSVKISPVGRPDKQPPTPSFSVEPARFWVETEQGEHPVEATTFLSLLVGGARPRGKEWILLCIYTESLPARAITSTRRVVGYLAGLGAPIGPWSWGKKQPSYNREAGRLEAKLGRGPCAAAAVDRGSCAAAEKGDRLLPQDLGWLRARQPTGAL